MKTLRNFRLADEVLRETRKDWLVYSCIIAHGTVVASIAWYFGETDKLTFLSSWTGLVANAFRLPAIFLLYLCALAMWKNPAEPAKELWRQIRSLISPRILAACFTVAALALFLGMFTAAKNLLPLFGSFVENEKQLADLDVLLHGQDVWHYFQPTLDYIGARRLFEFVYGPVWFLLVMGLPFMIIVLKRFEPVRQPFLITWLVCWIVLGNLAAAYFISAGPVFYGQVTGDFDRFGELVDRVAISRGLEFSAFDIQSGLWRAYVAKSSHLGTGISDCPSIHVSMATLIYLISRQRGTLLKMAAATFLSMIFIGSVYLGWHYAVSGYFAAVATIIIWNAVWWAYRGRSSVSRSNSIANAM